jgi:hypothetical protein
MSLSFSKIEMFQGGTTIDDAYSGTQLKEVVSLVKSSFKEGKAETTKKENEGITKKTNKTIHKIKTKTKTKTKSKIGGLIDYDIWDFLGFDDFEPHQQKCLFSCAKNGTKCLGKCNDNDKCEYKCIGKGIGCVQKCNNLPEPTLPTTTPIPTKSKKVEVAGVRSNSSNYAPYNNTLWPQYSKVGWDTSGSEFKNYTSDDTIEILVNTSLYPFTNEKPKLLWEK